MPNLLAAILPGVEMLSSKAIGQAFPLNHAKGITWYPVFIPMPPHHSMLHPHRTRQYRPREGLPVGEDDVLSLVVPPMCQAQGGIHADDLNPILSKLAAAVQAKLPQQDASHLYELKDLLSASYNALIRMVQRQIDTTGYQPHSPGSSDSPGSAHNGDRYICYLCPNENHNILFADRGRDRREIAGYVGSPRGSDDRGVGGNNGTGFGGNYPPGNDFGPSGPQQFYPGNNGSFSSTDAGQNNGHYGHNFSGYTGATNRDDEDSTSSYSCGEADTVSDVAPSPSCCSSDIPHAMDVPAPSSIISQHLALMQMTEETESCDSVSREEDYPPSTSGESDLRDLGDETYRRISRPPNDAASDRKQTPSPRTEDLYKWRCQGCGHVLVECDKCCRLEETIFQCHLQIPRRKHSLLRTKLQVISGILILRATVLRRKPMMISSTETSAEVSEPSKIGTELQLVEPGVQVSPTLEVMFSRGTEVVADAVSSLITGVMSATEEEMEYFKPISVHVSNLFTKRSTWLGEESLIE
ncbi:hypothetical protein CBS76997_7866 [Aspergillus niger]|nr:hypothetical protein CBS13152_3478 [Aspergillus niger]KAI3039516.1 hypothetical protein CBS76997_7866 [Aspergillus niger]